MGRYLGSRAGGNLAVARRVEGNSMKTLLWTATAALALALPAAADDHRRVRSLTGDYATAGVQRVELRLPPGSVRIEPSPDGRLHVDLGVHCSFDDSRCEDRAERLNLESNRRGNTLDVRVDGMSNLSSLRFHVRGRILVPQGKSLEVDFPAGELAIRGLRGDLSVDAGAGEISILIREADVRSVRLGVGIGEASLSVAGRNIEGSGWLGQRVRWGEGAGASRVAVNLGVGELGVTLD
jgi:hypothetical protein